MKTPRNRKQWLADIGALAGILLILVAASEVIRELRISANPVAVIGTVVEKDLIEGDEETPDSYKLRYAFTTESGAEYRRWATVDPQTYDRAELGVTVAVQYAADDPGNSRLAGNNGIDRWYAAVMVGVTGTALFGALGVWRWLAVVVRGERDPALEW